MDWLCHSRDCLIPDSCHSTIRSFIDSQMSFKNVVVVVVAVPPPCFSRKQKRKLSRRRNRWKFFGRHRVNISVSLAARYIIIHSFSSFCSVRCCFLESTSAAAAVADTQFLVTLVRQQTEPKLDTPMGLCSQRAFQAAEPMNEGLEMYRQTAQLFVVRLAIALPSIDLAVAGSKKNVFV